MASGGFVTSRLLFNVDLVGNEQFVQNLPPHSDRFNVGTNPRSDQLCIQARFSRGNRRTTSTLQDVFGTQNLRLMQKANPPALVRITQQIILAAGGLMVALFVYVLYALLTNNCVSRNSVEDRSRKYGALLLSFTSSLPRRPARGQRLNQYTETDITLQPLKVGNIGRSGLCLDKEGEKVH
jgi:hypothetical protein